MKEAVRRASSHTVFRRGGGTYSLDMWIPQPTGRGVETAVTKKAPAANNSRDDMELDALEHFMVPAAEWKQHCQYRCKQMASSSPAAAF